MNFIIPDRWKLYALIAIAFVAGLLGVRSMWITTGEMKVREKIAQQKAKAAKEATEIRNEVEALDRDTLRDRSTRWVRNSKR